MFSSWQSSLPHRVGKYNPLNPKDATETGIFPNSEDIELEEPVQLEHEGDTDDLLIYGIDDTSNGLVARIRRHAGDRTEGEIWLKINGKSYAVSTNGKSTDKEFAVGTMKLELVEAMRCWRLWFNGIARETDGTPVHLAVHGLWKPLNDPTDLRRDANVELMAEELKTRQIPGLDLMDMKTKIPEGYSQFGTVHLWVQVDQQPETELYLYGFRVRRSQLMGQSVSGSALEIFGMTAEDANAFRLAAHEDLWTHAEIQHVSGNVRPHKAVTTNPALFGTNKGFPESFTISGPSDTYNVEVKEQKSSVSMETSHITLLSMSLNGLKSNGILVRHKPTELKKTAGDFVGHSHVQVLEQGTEPDFVALDSEGCLETKLVGGKGASLAALDRLINRKQLRDQYKTAAGFCVTTALFRRVVNLDKISGIFACAVNDAELSDACVKVQDLIIQSGLENTIAPLISPWMKNIFGKSEAGTEIKRFAVRSSGVLEDGADVSAAGQKDTYLGVNQEQVPVKVLACWATLFTFQSVRYRLNHGQPAVSEIGVVIQEMVNADAAGVMFTADPLTGNPFEILINANYGLGESVVAATCDPDTIKVQRSRDFSGDLTVTGKVLGQKVSKLIVCDGSSGDLTEEVEISDQDAQRCCIDDGTAIKLGAFGLILMEANDGKPVDVEWAVHSGTIYVLQSRNITTLDSWTDDEIIHEFDSSIRTPFERLSTANTGEVAPGACSPLALSFTMRAIELDVQNKTCQRSGHQPMPYSFQCMAVARHRLLLNLVQTMYRSVESEITPAVVASDLTVLGHPIIDEEIHRIAVTRWGLPSAAQPAPSIEAQLEYFSGTGKALEHGLQKLSKYSFPLAQVQDDPLALYQRILEQLPTLIQAADVHMTVSGASSGMQILTTLVISEGKPHDDWDTKIYNDASKMVSACMSGSVESTDIPAAIAKVAATVVQDCKANAVEMPTDPQEALDWIQGSPELATAYEEFMEKHGHRGLFEMDPMRLSWGTDPIPFIKLLQSNVRSKSVDLKGDSEITAKQQLDDDQLIESLDSPTQPYTRELLKTMLPLCRSTVWNREKSKSLLVYVNNEFKKAFFRLSHLLAEKRLIPDAHLLYFLTLDEVRQILTSSETSARIISKALRRRKLHPTLDKEEFPEVMIGLPRPIEIDEHIELGDSIKGTPVSSGKVRGTVKVCLTVEDAAELIQPGDIMIARSTDIAWSPLFPMLGGVVTELGGLVSHGAVVAREYGLPCIVGATNATRIFKTGETVLLDATNGIMSKVPA